MAGFLRAVTLAVIGALALIGSSLAAASADPDTITRSGASYIVVLQPTATDVDRVAGNLLADVGGQLEFVYRHALRGFSARLTPRAAAALARNPLVAWVEADQRVEIAAQELPTGIRRIFADENPNLIDGSDDRRVDVDVAVIDTGIDLDHPDLNVVRSVDCSGGSPFRQRCKDGGDDDNGHGTHVAGTIGALDNGIGVVGVAPGARLWSVKVLRSDGSGYISWIVAGIDYVTANADRIEVANMSLGCECSSDALDTALTNSVQAGVAYAVAAGNADKDAATFSPANHPDVLTVSALADFDGEPGGLGSPTCRIDQDDTLADFSNWGSSVEIAAPGVCVLSTWNDGGYATLSGTSMASPHAAGALALLASVDDPNDAAAVHSLYATLVSQGNLDWVDDSGDGTQEPLLDVGDASVFDPVTVGGGGSTTGPVLSGSSTSEGRTWTATVTLAGSPGDSTVGTWDYDGSSGGCTIAAGYDSCSFSLTGIPKKVGSVVYTDDPGDGVDLGSVAIGKP